MKKKNGKKRRSDIDERKSSGPKWHHSLEPGTKKGIMAVFFFALTVISLLSYWGRAGTFGDYAFKILDTLFGKGYFIIPITLTLIGFSFLYASHSDVEDENNKKQHIFSAPIIGGFLMFMTSLGLLDAIFQNMTAGYVGYLVSYPFLQLFDFWATIVLLGSLFFISLLITLNIPLTFRRRSDEDEEEEEDDDMFAEKGTSRVTNAIEAVKETVNKVQEAIPMREMKKEPSEKDEEDRFMSKALERKVRKMNYTPPPFDLLQSDKGAPSSGDIRANANIIQRTLQSFGIDVEMGEVSIGPTVTQYTLKPAEGVKISKITALNNNLALALAAHPIRIEAPIPGKSLVGIEIPNKSIALVGLRALIETSEFAAGLPLTFALGRDVTGSPVFADLAKMPHLLVAGATGAGKSVNIHTIITSFLYKNPPEMLRFIMVDPKRVELSAYNGIPHLLTPVIMDAKKAISALRWAVKEMENRYEVLSSAGVRDIISYNSLMLKDKDAKIMPYIVVMVDELADLMMSYPREVEASVVRLAQMARAVGIHLIISTQRPSVEVITGLIKANITSRIALQVASQIDSRTILDMPGAEKLLGHGDMLFLAGDVSKPRRIQGGFLSEAEVKKVVKFIKDQVETPEYEEGITEAPKPEEFEFDGGEKEDPDDEMYEEAKKVVIEAGKASASYLQRRLRLGYARAARLIDILEERGIVGPGDGAKPREILVKQYPEGSEEAKFMNAHEKNIPPEI
ncbi:MAG: DNA translocase FtsK 4TM domain-containing protein [Patescibacteria group bacterium]